MRRPDYSTPPMHGMMKRSMPRPQSHTLLAFCFWCIHLLCLVERCKAQAISNATTDPSEAAILNSIFQQWNIFASSDWNISGELCSGSALTGMGGLYLGIECQCNNGSICRITKLKVDSQISRGHIIPEAIGKLTHLTVLNLRGNYLTGPLPSSIGNLRAMQDLNLNTNLLSGSIPKELGNLRNLTSLSLGTNSFNGSLPPEMGNLVNLQGLFLDSIGVSGPIPSTFANLVNLETLWVFDNEHTGTIPDFIGNWSKLKFLYLHGNAFQGPIPSSLSSLASLTDLRIGEIMSGTSSLAFIKGMRSLNTLILRNSKISDTIPFNIGEYRSLQYLFLGNNNLSGSLPSRKSSSLKTIDLSYNQLSGSFPSWITQGLQLNLVANNFDVNSFNNRFSTSLPSGLNCLQRDFSCYQDSLTDSAFAINCGGPEITSEDGMVYDGDVDALGPATYYLDNVRRVAVSNVMVHRNNENDLKIPNYQSQITNTSDPELFRTTRISQGSLRYYKLGLVNGEYKVTLQFAEIQMIDSNTQSGFGRRVLDISADSNTQKALGRRVFDIFSQGNLQFKDFDIRKTAGGVSNRAVLKSFKVNVSKNFLDIHLFWAGKGTCCIPAEGTYGPSIAAINITPQFPPKQASKKNKTLLIVGIVIGAGALSFISIFAIFIWRRRSRHIDEDKELLEMGTKPNTFSYSELRTATGDFSLENKLGMGGFGAVYKGTLSDGRIVAAKQLSVASHHGNRQFVTEIVTISAVQHRNLVKLYGCCIDGDKRLLVYEYLENRSLDHALFGDSKLHLNWPTRYRICMGTARGLTYLHEESRLRIVHRDVKASNILLDADLNPKISDFGLAKLYDDKKTHISTRVAGTIGYLAPEYALRGHLTEKADVFGFGVVALEILSGRPNTDTSLDQDKIYLLEWAWTLHEANRPLELIDPTLSEFDNGEALRMIGVALLCTQTSPVLRPPMSRVVAMLSGDVKVSSVTSRPSYLTLWQFNDLTNSLSDYMSRGSMGITMEGQCDMLNNSSWSTPAERLPLPTQPFLQEIIGEREG
ncbi:probable LRR receptor-like serine/threonine-protein kinase At1g56140 isoform X5 [Magnolia sinica]|uniref:probable LRR receptor-like serine/threonine-protein kinase At1g56140 isoform X5 n=1 Tax=Magnolia sinica TaxID=86752 RepID=UPI002657F0C2|nr:probable LRR receptor-like serine/threonine-protein kinase At1g56140 isoform X5 [Magnolia sinica]